MLPKHMPKTKIISVVLNGITLRTSTRDYTYVVENGRFVSIQINDGVIQTLSWK